MGKFRERLFGFGLLALLGCVPVPEPGPGTLLVDRPPPDLMPENVGAPPGTGQVWLRGYWEWNGDDYRWVPGRWVEVPAGYRAWISGRWVSTRKGWFWIEGHWR